MKSLRVRFEPTIDNGLAPGITRVKVALYADPDTNAVALRSPDLNGRVYLQQTLTFYEGHVTIGPLERDTVYQVLAI